jgi:sugar lactone lactonase YvrE
MRTELRFNTVPLLMLLAATASAHPGSGIEVDRQGVVYFTDTGKCVCKVDAQGKLTDLPGSRFHWLGIDEVGAFADSERSFGGWFERVTEKGARPCVVQCSDFPFTFARDGNLYYADTREGRGRIVRRTPQGRETVLARDPALESIDGITCSPDGSLYFTQSINMTNEVALRKITMAGEISTLAENFAGREPVKDPPAETPAGYCRGLAVDADGVVYVAATGSRRVLRITPQGQVSTILESPAPWQPTGIALFDGAVYVLEWSEPPAARVEERDEWIPRIRKVGRDGAVETVVTARR